MTRRNKNKPSIPRAEFETMRTILDASKRSEAKYAFLAMLSGSTVSVSRYINDAPEIKYVVLAGAVAAVTKVASPSEQQTHDAYENFYDRNNIDRFLPPVSSPVIRGIRGIGRVMSRAALAVSGDYAANSLIEIDAAYLSGGLPLLVSGGVGTFMLSESRRPSAQLSSLESTGEVASK